MFNFDRCFSFQKKKKARQFNLRKSWFIKGLAETVKKKNMLYCLFLTVTLPMKMHSTWFTICIRADSHEISDPKEIANLFCKYYTNIGPNLARKIPASEKSNSSFLPPKLVNSIFLEVANEQEIIEICGTCRSLL